jgi:hypothetical protein
VVPACQVSSKDGHRRRHSRCLRKRFGQAAYETAPPHHGENGHLYQEGIAGVVTPPWFAYSPTFPVSPKSLPVVVSVDALLPLVPSHALARVLLTATLALALLPLYAARSLAAKRIIYATWASFFAYLTWLGAVSYAHAKGTLSTDPHWQRPGVLWEGIS